MLSRVWEAVWMVLGGYLEGLGGCLEDVWRLSGACSETVWTLWGWCLF